MWVLRLDSNGVVQGELEAVRRADEPIMITSLGSCLDSVHSSTMSTTFGVMSTAIDKQHPQLNTNSFGRCAASLLLSQLTHRNEGQKGTQYICSPSQGSRRHREKLERVAKGIANNHYNVNILMNRRWHGGFLKQYKRRYKILHLIIMRRCLYGLERVYRLQIACVCNLSASSGGSLPSLVLSTIS